MLISDGGNEILLVEATPRDTFMYAIHMYVCNFDELNNAWVEYNKHTSTLLSLLLLYFVACCY